MLERLFHKLRSLTTFSDEDAHLLASLHWSVDRYQPNADVIQEGDDPRYVNLILDGWACRYKDLEDGRRQTIALFVPGDMCDPCISYLNEMSHSLAALTPITIARLPALDMMAAIRKSVGLAEAMWLEMLVTAEVQREWTVSLGRRTARERMAHLFCEMQVRLRAVGLADSDGYELPITQAELGDALGLSAVHVNRTLQDLRGMQTIDLRSKRLVIRDVAALRRVALFNPDYLHLKHDNV